MTGVIHELGYMPRIETDPSGLLSLEIVEKFATAISAGLEVLIALPDQGNPKSKRILFGYADNSRGTMDEASCWPANRVPPPKALQCFIQPNGGIYLEITRTYSSDTPFDSLSKKGQTLLSFNFSSGVVKIIESHPTLLDKDITQIKAAIESGQSLEAPKL